SYMRATFHILSDSFVLLSVSMSTLLFFFFFFNDTATTEIYTLSLHDALPILIEGVVPRGAGVHPAADALDVALHEPARAGRGTRSEEHTSELQSRSDLVCRLLLEKKKKITNKTS